MHAHKLNVTVQPDHRLAIVLPDDFPQGPAEVIVLAQVREVSQVSQGGPEEEFARLFPRDPALMPVIFHEDPTAPLHPDDWPEASDEAAP